MAANICTKKNICSTEYCYELTQDKGRQFTHQSKRNWVLPAKREQYDSSNLS